MGRLSKKTYDAIVIGSGPNGLAAAITIAQAGRSVLLIEGQEEIGGAMRSVELTLPNFIHDFGSAVHPMAISSPFFRTLPLAKHGLEWVHPSIPLAHPLDDDRAVLAKRDLRSTAANLGQDGERYFHLISPLMRNWSKIESLALGPPSIPRHPIAAARFGLVALRSAKRFAGSYFHERRARAVFAGMSAHSILPLERATTAAFGLVFSLTAHTVGWPIARGGSRNLAFALASYLRSLGGDIVTNFWVRSMEELPRARTLLFDLTPRQLVQIDGLNFTESFRREMERYPYGPGVCKVDWALDAPIPWMDPECARAGTLHLGGTLDEIAESERAPWKGKLSDKPFVLLAQPTLFDSTRAPAGKHIAWAYCHVPNASNIDASEEIENQVERFAPGFRNRILKKSVLRTSDMERWNPNLVGGDIVGGSPWPLRLRPTHRLYGTSTRNVYICSSSTPPGGGVHGMCGHHAALRALREFDSR